MRTPPSGLFGLLVAEFWERFSYFAVLSLLALNLNERLLLSEGQASTLAGSFAALSYLTPLFGGWLADRGLGAGRTILLGAICLLAGYLALMHASLAATYGAIGLLALGSGLFKPSFTTWLSSLAGDPASGQRQASFRWLFFCVNLAAAVAPLCIGGIQARRGFAAAFAFCALSMLLCLACIAALFLRSIRNGDMPKRAADEAKAGAGPRALAVLCLPSIAFFVVFSQSMGALVFWARDHIDRTLGGLALCTYPARDDLGRRPRAGAVPLAHAGTPAATPHRPARESSSFDGARSCAALRGPQRWDALSA
ncbi:MAG: MFS transporter [Myxococcales bacterium]|nr:MFS transporter [Myxococcales bacterium]